ncbi:MAG: hypothetical protein CSA62_07580 [Planctomycetota bacterium]|nr:MAG: hypothetical protein CSA62_07580 [Planctomycetota bacterium]
MKLPITLVAALAVCPYLAAQHASGSLNGSNPQQQHNPDGTVGNAPVFPSIQNSSPFTPPGSLTGPILSPQEKGVVALNKNGGTLSKLVFLKDRWFVHKVVAPRNMTITNFEFFCQTNLQKLKVTTGLFLDSSGKPAKTPVRTSSMFAWKSAAFRGSPLSAPLYLSKGRVFYIGYKIPKTGQFYVDLINGSNTTYFWGPPISPSWQGPLSHRKVAWRIDSYDRGYTYTFGSACNTKNSRGQGQGTWAKGINADATTTNNRAWKANARIVLPVYANRDMLVTGISCLSRVTKGSAWAGAEMYLNNGPNGSPGTRVRARGMLQSTTSRWNRANWRPYFVRKGTIYYVGFQIPNNYRISTDEGSSTPYYYRGPKDTKFSGPYSYSYIKFPLRVHTKYCENENQLASGNATAPYIRGAKFMHSHYADSDQWVSGFGFRCRVASGSASVRFELRLADDKGRPLNSAVRAVIRRVDSSNGYKDVHFTPIFIPRGSTYYVGYIIPDSSSVTFYPKASGTTYKTSYYWQSKSSSAWNSYSNPFARRIFTARTQLNPYATSNSTTAFSNDTDFAIKVTAPADMWVDGFELFASISSGNPTIGTNLYRANGPGGSPGQRVGHGIMPMDTISRWRPTAFAAPVFFAKGTSFYVGVTTLKTTQQRLRMSLNSGTKASYFWKRTTQSKWNGGTTGYTTPIALKVHGRTGAARLSYHGPAAIGTSLQVKLIGASPLRPYGLIFSPSSLKWGPIFLPWELPFWRRCKLYVGYDSLLTTGSTGSTGNRTIALPIPNDKNLIHVRFYNQFWVLERLGSQFEMSWTNGGGVRIGG